MTSRARVRPRMGGAALPDDVVNTAHELGLQQVGFGIGKIEIGEYVAAAALDVASEVFTVQTPVVAVPAALSDELSQLRSVRRDGCDAARLALAEDSMRRKRGYRHRRRLRTHCSTEPNDVRRPQSPAGSMLSAQGPFSRERPLLSEKHTPRGAQNPACRGSDSERVRPSGDRVERFDEDGSRGSHQRYRRRGAH